MKHLDEKLVFWTRKHTTEPRVSLKWLVHHLRLVSRDPQVKSARVVGIM